MNKFHQPKIKWTAQHRNYTKKQQGATQPLTNASKRLGRNRKLNWNIYSMKSIPAQDFMVRILRSRTTMLRRWVMSPNNLKRFMITAAATLSFPFRSLLLLYLDFLSFRFFLLRFCGVLSLHACRWLTLLPSREVYSVLLLYYLSPKTWIWKTTTWTGYDPFNQN